MFSLRASTVGRSIATCYNHSPSMFGKIMEDLTSLVSTYCKLTEATDLILWFGLDMDIVFLSLREQLL